MSHAAQRVVSVVHPKCLETSLGLNCPEGHSQDHSTSLPGDQLSMQFAPTLSSISTFDNCGAFGAKATIQRTDDSI